MAKTLSISVNSAVLALAVAVPLLIAQKESSKPEKPDKKDVYAELAKAPRKAVARRNPLEGDPDAVAAGANLYDEHCAECHGEMAEGGKKGPSLRADPVQQATPGTLFWILTNGVVRRGHAGLVQAPGAPALAACELSKVTPFHQKSPQLTSAPSCDFPPRPRIKRQWCDNRLSPVWGAFIDRIHKIVF